MHSFLMPSSCYSGSTACMTAICGANYWDRGRRLRKRGGMALLRVLITTFPLLILTMHTQDSSVYAGLQRGYRDIAIERTYSSDVEFSPFSSSLLCNAQFQHLRGGDGRSGGDSKHTSGIEDGDSQKGRMKIRAGIGKMSKGSSGADSMELGRRDRQASGGPGKSTKDSFVSPSTLASPPSGLLPTRFKPCEHKCPTSLSGHHRVPLYVPVEHALTRFCPQRACERLLL